MANMKLTIQHGDILYEPPIKDGIKLEWERTGVPGKLTFTVLKTSGLNFTEGDPVCFYYNDKSVFMGYVFKKKRDREHHIEVTCYDQLRYFKNKYTYVFEKKTASQIIKALCGDFNINTGVIDNTNYVISAIAEENKSAFDIALDVLEDTLLNTGEMFVLYDDFGKIKLKNCADMISTTLIMEDTAQNFDYTSSIDDETYNQVVLYYKNDNKIQQIYTASSPSTIKQWGTLRYFEEVKTPSIGQNKANSLLKLYNKKTRELKVTGAFGDITVRGGTLLPVKLYLGDVTTNNFMVVESVTHTFENDSHTMDLTLEGAWEDSYTADMVSNTIGEIVEKPSSSNTTNIDPPPKTETKPETKTETKTEVKPDAIAFTLWHLNYEYGKGAPRATVDVTAIPRNNPEGLVRCYTDSKMNGTNLGSGIAYNSDLYIDIYPPKGYKVEIVECPGMEITVDGFVTSSGYIIPTSLRGMCMTESIDIKFNLVKNMKPGR